jgi:hypothetical protein
MESAANKSLTALAKEFSQMISKAPMSCLHLNILALVQADKHIQSYSSIKHQVLECMEPI